MNEDREIVIGNRGADYVLLKLDRRDREGWSRAEIEVHCDGWFGRIKGEFLKGELARFAQEVRQLHRDLSGTARLYPIEPIVALALIGDGRGHVAVDGNARNDFGSGTQLTFRFTIDQTYLTGIADALSDADPA